MKEYITFLITELLKQQIENVHVCVEHLPSLDARCFPTVCVRARGGALRYVLSRNMTATMGDHVNNNASNNDTATNYEEALEKTGNGLYNTLLVSTCSLILLAIGMDLFGFSLVVTAACDLNLTVTQMGILTSLPFIGTIQIRNLE
ncbi:unnamed protein product [Diatraea saccharalis]|uniref:Uncharacterized protein n=1 Tax=Diatraea saccharalis TaxID=40085 RepID=A0A9N9WDH5_9NEOP|nr:unnamed protein product [Diatraea saccharalis]